MLPAATFFHVRGSGPSGKIKKSKYEKKNLAALIVGERGSPDTIFEPQNPSLLEGISTLNFSVI